MTSEHWTSPASEWHGTDEERAAAMFREALLVEQQPQNVAEVDADSALLRMYEQRPISSLNAYSYEASVPGLSNLFQTSTVKISEWNVLRAVVNTAWAMIARAKVRGRFITSKGTAARKQRAMDATRFLDGWTEQAEVHDVAGQCLRDAMVCRFGVAQIFELDGKVGLQRCLPHEISVDIYGAQYGSPRTFYRRRPVAKQVLLAQFGKGKNKADVRAAIEAAKACDPDNSMVLVREAWSIPTTSTSGDGWHIVAVEGNNGALLVEEWKKPWPPLVFFFWDRPVIGFGGVSLASQLETMQTQLNRMAWVEKQVFAKMVPRLAVQRGSRIVKSQLTNEAWSIIEYSGNEPPRALVWPGLSAEFYAERDKLVGRMYELTGISQHASEGVKAPGAESGVAQREAMEAQNLRIQIYSLMSWERPIVQIFERAVEMIGDVVKRTGSYEVEATDRDGIETVDFAKVVKDLKTRKVTIYPTGFLPLTPAARLDYVMVLLKSGLWDVDRCRQALADLDTDYMESAENAILQMFVRTFEKMLYEGKPQRPTELDVAYYDIAHKTATVSLAMARNDKTVSRKNIQLAMRYLDELKALKQATDQASQPPAPQAPAPANDNAQPAQPVPAVA